MGNKGTLFLIPTTLGGENHSLIFPPVHKDIVEQTNHYIVENAKTARRFIKSVGISTPIQELDIHELNKHGDESESFTFLKLLEEGVDIGLLSEAGTPAVADPGHKIVKRAHELGAKVSPLVGPNSILLALMGSGMNGQCFKFHGYLPKDSSDRKRSLKFLEKESRTQNLTQIFIETPYRNEAMLENLKSSLSHQTRLCVAFDLTLPSETIISQPISKWSKIKIDFHKKPAIFLIHSDK